MKTAEKRSSTINGNQTWSSAAKIRVEAVRFDALLHLFVRVFDALARRFGLQARTDVDTSGQKRTEYPTFCTGWGQTDVFAAG
jgi:hypothetical protein